ncbi:Tryptophan--tRNA ligase 2 [compost metagenome]
MRLTEVLENLIGPIRQRREEFEKDRGEVMNLLFKGSNDAREVAAQTLKEIREAMHLNY